MARPARLGRAGLPLVALVPALVVAMGAATALAVTLAGLSGLRQASDDAASARGAALAGALASRVATTASEERSALVLEANRVAGAGLYVLDDHGAVAVGPSPDALPLERRLACLLAGGGELTTPEGRARFAVRPVGPPLDRFAVLAIVAAPEVPPASTALVRAIAALTVVLVGVAGMVAHGMARSAHDDVAWLRRRIVAMAREGAPPSGTRLPVRGLDQVGVLTAAFDALVDRFTAAEHVYRSDLAEAATHDRERTILFASVSHELRTPLNVILGFADVLLADIDGPLDADARENVEHVRAAAAHLGELVDDLLELSAMEAGDLRLARAEVDVGEIADAVAGDARPAAAAKGLEVRVEGASSTKAYADPRRVRQVLANLVGNAVKFTSEGAVTVRVAGNDRWVAVQVEDSGPGLSAAEQAVVFDAFRQAGGAASRRGGTGLGLAIARRLVELMGGRIELRSAPGSGACFTVSFPSVGQGRP